jgi:putative transposase
MGWAISKRLKQDLALRALNMAIAIRRPPPGCMHHTDRGPQYCAHDYQKLLRKHGFKLSMSGKGNCYDNSAVESFFTSLKAERVWRRNWQTRQEIEVTLFEYINGFYNPRRKHSALGWKPPVAFEQRAAQHEYLTGPKPGQVQARPPPARVTCFNPRSRTGSDLSPTNVPSEQFSFNPRSRMGSDHPPARI